MAEEDALAPEDRVIYRVLEARPTQTIKSSKTAQQARWQPQSGLGRDRNNGPQFYARGTAPETCRVCRSS